jgi:hypothetical protein
MPVFKKFEEDDIVKSNPTEVTLGIFTGDTGSMSTFFTGAQSASLSGQFYWNVYNINPTSSLAEVQFAVAYGHRTGGGNTTLAVDNSATLSTKATYLQYRNLLLEPDDPQFTFAGSYNSDHIYVLNFARQRLKEKLDPGNWSLTLKGASGSFTFIDDSGQTLGVNFGTVGDVFNVVSGSLSGSTGATIAATSASNGKGGFGLVYPGLGLIVLNPDAISSTIGMVSGSYTISGSTWFGPNTGSTTTEYNHVGLLSAIKGGAFAARSAENISSTHYFVRLRNKEFNYSNNPTFYNQSNGVINNSDFYTDPRVYVTTVGLYNDTNELLAVAKLSKPIQKAFDRESIIRCRLDW